MSQSIKMIVAAILILVFGVILSFAVGMVFVNLHKGKDVVMTTPSTLEISIAKPGRYYFRGGDVIRDGRLFVYLGNTMPEGISFSIAEKSSRNNIPMVASPDIFLKEGQKNRNIGYFELKRPGKYILSLSGNKKGTFFIRRDRSSDDLMVFGVVLCVSAVCVLFAVIIFLLAICDLVGDSTYKMLIGTGQAIVRCVACGGEIPAKNISIFKNITKCDACGKVLRYSTLAEIVSDKVEADALKTPKGSISKPKNFTIETTGEGLLITRNWLSVNYAKAFSLSCGSLLILFGAPFFWRTLSAWKGGADTAGEVFLGAALISIAYPFLIFGVNRTQIRITQGGVLRIMSRPVPWPKGKNISRGDLRQLYSKEIIHYSRGGKTSFYAVRALTHEGRSIDLIKGLPTREEALFIEQEIEKQLGIIDEPVPEEVD